MIHMIKIEVKSKFGDLDLFVKVPETNKRKKVCHEDISTPKICIASVLLPVIHFTAIKYDNVIQGFSYCRL